MAKAALSSVIRRLVSAQARTGPPDRHLLERFIAHKDEGAFAALVERHGAMVQAVARSVLHHWQDAEDVFQATFLVLARQAGSVRKGSSVGSWLHGVAYRLALKARTAAATRHRLDSRVPPRASYESPDDLTWRELNGILHEELAHLADKYRAPLVLCYLEGLTQDQAAKHLGLAKGTFKGRLERARLLLRGRLSRRGLAPAVVLLADATRPAGAALPRAVASSMARTAAVFAAGQAASVSVQVAQMTEGVLRAMFLMQLRSAAAILLLAIGVAAAATGVLASHRMPDGPPATVEPRDAGRGTPEKPGVDGVKEPRWGEAVGGWRMRLTTPAGTEYRRNRPLPLSLELQNVSGGPLSFDLLATSADPEVNERGKRLVVCPLIDVSPWEGRRDQLPAGARLKWEVDFDRLRFLAQHLKAGTALRVRFGLAMQGATPEDAPAVGKRRRLLSNEVPVKLRDDHPSVETGAADLPPTWASSMLLVYRDYQGALRIDGKGRAALVTLGDGKGQAVTRGLIRTEAVLNRGRLDRLARFLRGQRLSELSSLAYYQIGAIGAGDKGGIWLSVGSGRGSFVASFPDSVVRDQPKLLALQAEMAKVMALVREKADDAKDPGKLPLPPGGGSAKPAAPAEDEIMWGKEVDGLQAGAGIMNGNSVRVGEKVTLVVKLRNVSKAAITVSVWPLWLTPPRVVDAAGKRVRATMAPVPLFEIIPAHFTLKPCQTVDLGKADIAVAEDEVRDQPVKVPEGVVDWFMIHVAPGRYKANLAGFLQHRPSVSTGTVEFEVKAASGKGTPDATPRPTVATELAKFDGTWVLVSTERNGQATSEEKNPYRLTFAGDKWKVHRGDEVAVEGTLRLVDITATPKKFDLIKPPRLAPNITVDYGIYEWKDDMLRYCTRNGPLGAGPDGHDLRPRDFTTRDGDGRTVYLWKRAK
jgi:RNA polymerase sigma factor (sigma-70 family)